MTIIYAISTDHIYNSVCLHHYILEKLLHTYLHIMYYNLASSQKGKRMDFIEFLGTSGTRTPTQGTTCVRVSPHCVIDAGNLINALGDNVFTIEHIFLTHSHLDHIIDIPFLADLFVTQKSISLKIYGLKSTLDDLRQFIFNYRVWPNFEEIHLIGHNGKTIELIEINVEHPYEIDGITLTPFKTNHTDGSCGYLIEKDGNGILFTADTYRCSRIWELLDANPHIHSLVIETSFPSSFEELASKSNHLTPMLLGSELSSCKRNDFRIYIMHLKTLFASTIMHELESMEVFKRGGKVLIDYDRIFFNR
jgi:ribonuclease BN (tRNA processing enzyme)